MKGTRRDFVRGMASAAMLAGVAKDATAATAVADSHPARKPNIVLYMADQMRWDFVGGYGLNPTVKTPNIDKIMQRGVAFTGAVTNQPICSPSRACIFTSRYGTENGMWKLPPGAQMRRDLPTLATELRAAGYTANIVGKWHLAPVAPITSPDYQRDQGFVQPEDRGGMLDHWQAANVPELTSHPYEGDYWQSNGDVLHFKDEYRVDFVTDLAVKFLKTPQAKPFFLFVSQVEPHHQNDMDRVVAPNGYADLYKNPYVPPDLRAQPGDWQSELPDYYGCVQRIDESVGTILKTLEEQGQLDNTIFVFMSDHGCHFRTRNREYKRSPQDGSIRIPLVMQGPGFDHAMQRPEIVSTIDITPTLLAAAGVPVPASMKGSNLLPLLHDPAARQSWPNRALIQVSETMVGRAIRTKDWTYCVIDRSLDGFNTPTSMHYEEHFLYDNGADPAQLVNLAGRAPFREKANELQAQLLDLIAESGEPRPSIAPAKFYP